MASHPERTGDIGLEPGVGELLALREALDQLDRMNEESLRDIAKSMAKLVMVVYPSAVRWLAAEAARNLGHGLVPIQSGPFTKGDGACERVAGQQEGREE